jgi:hypothetical protein
VPVSGLPPFIDLTSERSAMGVAPFTMKVWLNTTAFLLETTFTFHVPTLSAMKTPEIIEVSVLGTVNESVCGSVVMGVTWRPIPEGSTHEKLRLKARLIPDTLAQTSSPKLKVDFGVVQLAAYVVIGSGAACGSGNRFKFGPNHGAKLFRFKPGAAVWISFAAEAWSIRVCFTEDAEDDENNGMLTSAIRVRKAAMRITELIFVR